MNPSAPAAVSVLALNAERFMILNEVSVAFDAPGVHLVAGQNGNGKTALQWAIACTIDPSLAPDEPIQRGEKESKIRVDFGEAGVVEFSVETSWWINTGSKNAGALEVKQVIKWPNGATQTTKVADWVRARLGIAKGEGRFDPFELARLGRNAEGRRKQAAILKRVVGLDTSDLETRIATLAAQRLPFNQEVDRLRALAQSVVIPPAPTEAEVGEKKTVAAALAEVEARRSLKKSNDQVYKAADEARAAEDAARAKVARLRDELAAAEDELKTAAAAAESRMLAAAQLPPDPDIAAAEKALADLDAFNAGVDERRRKLDERRAAEAKREERFGEAEAAAKRAAALTEQIRAAEAEVRARIAAVNFPIPGLGFAGDEVTFNDGEHGPVPLSQASAAQQIRVWLALRLAQHPSLRYIAVDSWSLLDDAMATAAAEWATEHGVRILAEYVPHRVKVDGVYREEEVDGLIIQAGTIVADRRPGGDGSRRPRRHRRTARRKSALARTAGTHHPRRRRSRDRAGTASFPGTCSSPRRSPRPASRRRGSRSRTRRD